MTILLWAQTSFAAPLDLPVPSPCAQRSEGYVGHYLYDADRFLERIVIDDDADGRADVVVRFTHDADGRPLKAFHDDDADGVVDRTTDCRTGYCSTNWIPVCPARAECTRNALGLVERVTFPGGTPIVNDYACWTKVEGLWTWRRPDDVPSVPSSP